MGDHKGFVLPAAAAPVGEGDDGVGDGMLCMEHPQYNQRGANPGGICPICLQEKLGRLVSSSPNNKASPHLFYPSALAAPPYSSDSPTTPPSSSLRADAVVEAAAVAGYGRAAGGSRTNSSYDVAGSRHRSSSGSRTGSSGRSRMIPFLYTTHSKKKKGASSSSGSSTTTRTCSTDCSRKVMSSNTSSSSLSAISTTTSSSSGSSAGNPVFKRSKSVAPRPSGGDAIMEDPEKFDSPRKKSFWSFLYLSSYQQHNHHHHHSLSSPGSTTVAAPVGSGIAKRRGAGCGGGSKNASSNTTTSSATAAATTTYIRDIKLLLQPPQLPVISTVAACSSNNNNNKPQENAKTPRREYPPATGGNAAPAAAATTAARGEEADDSPGSGSQASASFGRKVARSRSVGCGSRSFSGDFLERISTGFGDCTLRRVESQREAKPSAAGKIVIHHSGRPGDDPQELPAQRVRCGGIFGGFYSSTSSLYWLSEDLSGGASGRISTAAAAGDCSCDSVTPHARRSWVWAFASPMRAFRGSSSASTNKHGAMVSINGSVTATSRSASASTGAGTSTATAPSRATVPGGAAVLAVKG